MVAAALRADRFTVHHVGADVPVDDLVGLAVSVGADVAVLSVALRSPPPGGARRVASRAAEGPRHPGARRRAGDRRRRRRRRGRDGYGDSLRDAQRLAREAVARRRPDGGYGSVSSASMRSRQRSRSRMSQRSRNCRYSSARRASTYAAEHLQPAVAGAVGHRQVARPAASRSVGVAARDVSQAASWSRSRARWSSHQRHQHVAVVHLAEHVLQPLGLALGLPQLRARRRSRRSPARSAAAWPRCACRAAPDVRRVADGGVERADLVQAHRDDARRVGPQRLAWGRGRGPAAPSRLVLQRAADQLLDLPAGSPRPPAGAARARDARRRRGARRAGGRSGSARPAGRRPGRDAM